MKAFVVQFHLDATKIGPASGTVIAVNVAWSDLVVEK